MKTKTSAPRLIGNKRARLLSDSEMQGMHRFKKESPEEKPETCTRRGVMMFKERD